MRECIWWVKKYKSCVCFFLMLHFIYLKGERVKRERENIFQLLVLCPNACISWGWIRPKPGEKNSIWVFHMSYKMPTTISITCFSLENTLAGNWKRSRAGVSNPKVVTWDLVIPRNNLPAISNARSENSCFFWSPSERT